MNMLSDCVIYYGVVEKVLCLYVDCCNTYRIIQMQSQTRSIPKSIGIIYNIKKEV